MRMMKPMRYVAKDDIRGESARCGLTQVFRLPRQPDLRHSGNQHGRSVLHAEPFRILAVRQPDVDMRAADLATCVVHEKTAVILPADVQLDVARERKVLRVGGDDSRSHITAAPGGATETVRRQQYWNRIAVLRAACQSIPTLFGAPHDRAIEPNRTGDHDGLVPVDRGRVTTRRERSNEHRANGGRFTHSRMARTSESSTGVPHPVS